MKDLVMKLSPIARKVKGANWDAKLRLVRETFEERAAIRQHEGGMSKDDAELAAIDDTKNVFGVA